jgi:broad specificity phosphatase PhoE
MKKTIYLIRHSAPFIEIDNYFDYKKVSWSEYNKNMILSTKGESNAKKLCNIEELKNIDFIYASNSFRAIGTAKYIAEQNNLKIKLDDKINERELGVEQIADLPDNFSQESFNNKNLKIGFGESLNEVDKRFNAFINELLESDKNNIALFIHGIILMSYLEENCDFEFDGKIVKAKYKGKVVIDGVLKNPDIFKITFNNKKMIDIENIFLN